MTFPVDNTLSPDVAEHLRSAGHDAVHVRDRRLAEAEDEAILEVAVAEERVIVTADTDFGAPRRPAHQAALLLTHLPTTTDDLTHRLTWK